MNGIISRYLVMTAVVIGLLTVAAVNTGHAEATPAPRRTVATPGPSQMITVSAPSAAATTAQLTAWELQPNGTWAVALGPITANVGAAGVGTATEGSSKTPAGTWRLTQSFGRAPNPGTALPYFTTDALDWWSSNTTSPNYNTHVRQAANPGGNSENLYRIGFVYDYAVVMDYNLARTPRAGSAFFLHISDGLATGGCVAIDRESLVRIMQWLDPAKFPAITIGVNVPAPSAAPLKDGSFVLNAGTIYRIAGGAPIAVSNWEAVGGFQSYRTLSDSEFAALPAVPRDGIFMLGSDGTIYRVAGGAPIPVTDWVAVGGNQPFTRIDIEAIRNAGTGGAWNHLRPVPADGTFLRGSSGTIYRVAGGAPLAVSNWATVGGYQPFTAVDEVAITNAGHGGVWNHLRSVPADGTFVLGSAGTIYRVAGGAPLPVSDWATVGGFQSFTLVDEAAVMNAGIGGPWNHLRSVPADGTFLAGSSGTVYRVAGGAPIAVSDWANVGGYQRFIAVDEVAITNAGQAGLWNHLSVYPIDGTFIRPATDPSVYQVLGGVPTYVPSWDPYGGPQPTTLIDGEAINRAGSGGPWDHLKQPA